ncbi:MAG: hypothetical protein J3Q66DRAFT_367639 [Benniella sp.]|nr:MAG: hypothetical protein J3Q66DRAFT_367639 [Benniella sp.]
MHELSFEYTPTPSSIRFRGNKHVDGRTEKAKALKKRIRVRGCRAGLFVVPVQELRTTTPNRRMHKVDVNWCFLFPFTLHVFRHYRESKCSPVVARDQDKESKVQDYVSAVVGLFALLGMFGIHVYRKDRQEMKQRLGYREAARRRAQQVIGMAAFTVDRFVMTLA